MATVLTVPVFLLAMVIPDLGASGWLELVFATPVVLWRAWPFHRAAALNAGHLASTMDTLVSIGVLAAWCYSVAQLLTLPARPRRERRGGAAYRPHHPHHR